MEWVSMGVTIVGFVIVLWKFKYERMKIVGDVEAAAQARELNQAKLTSEEKRWAHDKLAEARLAALTKAVSVVSQLQNLAGAAAFVLETEKDNPDQQSSFLRELVTFVMDKSKAGQLSKVLIEITNRHAAISELTYWYKSPSDLARLDRAKAALLGFPAVMAFIIADRKDASMDVREVVHAVIDACNDLQAWMRDQLDPATFAKALSDGTSALKSDSSIDRKPSGNGQNRLQTAAAIS